MHLDEDSFRALARSSPWRWSTLRFVAHARLRSEREPVRAYVRRPDRLRVETLDGELVLARVEQREQTEAVLELRRRWSLGRSRGVPLSRADPRDVEPTVRPDGLVEERPSPFEVSYDDPMYRDYHWVAMLDPVELADASGRTGAPSWVDAPDGDGEDAASQPPITIDELVEVEHHGRPAWEALVRPTPSYEPRCDCCALLPTAAVDPSADAHEPGFTYGEAFRVRLDVGTGVCVASEQVGGTHEGDGHDLAIEAVDARMSDELFTVPRRRVLDRLLRR